MRLETGTEETRTFYDKTGWSVTDDGNTVDGDLFGVKEDGPVRVALHALLHDRISAGLTAPGKPVNVIECGCGGAPEKLLLDHCAQYTGVDFSQTGLDLAAKSFANAPVPTHFQTADICDMPFENATFDAVYSAHVIYHIEDANAQRSALQEMMRVTRPGGAIVVIAANPRPLLFPARLAMRLAASFPAVKAQLRKLKGPSPVPYNPQSIAWTRDVLSGCREVKVLSAGIASTWFNQKVSEHRGLGKWLWKTVAALENKAPGLSAYLGNYVIYVCRR